MEQYIDFINVIIGFKNHLKSSLFLSLKEK